MRLAAVRASDRLHDRKSEAAAVAIFGSSSTISKRTALVLGARIAYSVVVGNQEVRVDAADGSVVAISPRD